MRSRASICWIGTLLLAAAPALDASGAPPEEVSAALPSEKAMLEAYVQEGCPHCAVAEPYLRTLAADRPDVELIVYDVAHDPAALKRMQLRATAAGIEALGVPTIVVNGQIIIGLFSAETTPGAGEAEPGAGDDPIGRRQRLGHRTQGPVCPVRLIGVSR